MIDVTARMFLARWATELGELEYKAQSIRDRRDAVALRLVAQGATWREVADAAGFSNPYIAALKKRAGSAEPPAKPACTCSPYPGPELPSGFHDPTCPLAEPPAKPEEDEGITPIPTETLLRPAKPEEECACDYDRDDEGEWTGDMLRDRCPVHGPTGLPVKEGDDRP